MNNFEGANLIKGIIKKYNRYVNVVLGAGLQPACLTA